MMDHTKYWVVDEESGNREPVFLYMTKSEWNDRYNREALEWLAIESVEKNPIWLQTLEKPLPTPEQKKDIGKVLKEITASHQHYAESLHRRYY